MVLDNAQDGMQHLLGKAKQEQEDLSKDGMQHLLIGKAKQEQEDLSILLY
jgi:hypothetical protein